MAGHEVLSVLDDEFFDFYPTEAAGKGGCGATPSSGSSSIFGSKFNMDPSWLIDPRCLDLGEVIGEGPHSMVYEGLYKSKPVAIKVIQPTRIVDVSPDRREKFRREVSLLSKLKHENVVKFIGVCFEPSMMILTEYMRGGTLQKYLWNTRPQKLDLKLSLSFALDICRAMEYLHANGIIHRDLKPANLLLTEDRKQIRLADFGHAREEIAGAMTSEAGTYRWMAPELFSEEPLPREAKKQYDHKADVYSFSIVLWELLMNQTPFKGRNNVMVAYATAKKVRPDLHDIPPEIIPLLESCWAQDPTSRPEFMEITDYLSKLLNELCSTETTVPSNVVGPEVEHSESNMKEEESLATHHEIDRPQEKNKKKIKKEKNKKKKKKKKDATRRKKSRSFIFFWYCCACDYLSD